jgi:hypothetical protein
MNAEAVRAFFGDTLSWCMAHRVRRTGRRKSCFGACCGCFSCFSGSISLFVALLYGHVRSSEYQATTPTTATVDDCRESREAPDIKDCTGTWNLGGQRYHGDIDGVRNLQPPGSPVDVRANNVQAYAMTDTPFYWVPAYAVAGVLAVAVLALVVWGQSRRQPGQGR